VLTVASVPEGQVAAVVVGPVAGLDGDRERLVGEVQGQPAGEVSVGGAGSCGVYSEVGRSVAANLRVYREAAGLSQGELALRMADWGFGFSQATVWKVEQGRRPVRVSEAAALADVLGLPSWVALTAAPGSAGARRAGLELAGRRAGEAHERVEDAAAAYLRARAELAAAARQYRAAERAVEARAEDGGDGGVEAVEAVARVLREHGFQGLAGKGGAAGQRGYEEGLADAVRVLTEAARAYRRSGSPFAGPRSAGWAEFVSSVDQVLAEQDAAQAGAVADTPAGDEGGEQRTGGRRPGAGAGGLDEAAAAGLVERSHALTGAQWAVMHEAYRAVRTTVDSAVATAVEALRAAGGGEVYLEVVWSKGLTAPVDAAAVAELARGLVSAEVYTALTGPWRAALGSGAGPGRGPGGVRGTGGEA